MTSPALKLAAAGMMFGIALAAVANPHLPTSRRQAAAQWQADGLQKLAVRGLDVVYVRPGTSLRGYDKVLVRPPSIAFSRDWERTAALGSRIRSRDVQRIRESFAKLIHEEITRELSAAGYQVVATAALGALEIELSVVELYVNSPDLPTAARTETYALNSGRMTLVAELRDSGSGRTLRRVYDHASGPEIGPMKLITRGQNVSDARRWAHAWAVALRRQLDAARNSDGAS